MRLLISPLGMSPGVLFSAIQHAQPECIFVVSSPAASARLPEICAAANYRGRYAVFNVDDPFTAFTQAQPAWRELAKHLDGVTTVWVNITGGTTALQYIVQKLAEKLAARGLKPRLVALVDRRGRVEQENNPYKVGECIELTDAE